MKLSVVVFGYVGAAIVACGGDAAAPVSGSTPVTPPPASSSSSPPGSPPSEDAATPESRPCDGKTKLGGDLDWTIASGGKDRLAHVHVPASYDPAKPIPVVLNFHGYALSGADQAWYSGMNAKADAAGFVAVQADGIGLLKSWNAGVCCGDARDTKVDDVAFVAALLDTLEAKLCVDRRRVFSTGLSNGGFLSHRLACELSNRIAAIAPVAGVIGVPTCAPSRAVPVMHFHGTADAIVPYDGNGSGYPSVASTLTGWATRDGCTDAPRETFSKEDVRCMTQDQCSGGAAVTLCTVEGGGHTWPGGPDRSYLGRTTKAISATDAMWTFFEEHPLP